MIAVEPVVDDRTHVEALVRIAKLMGARYGTLDGDELETLSILSCAATAVFERRKY